jgi:hypothetical protein
MKKLMLLLCFHISLVNAQYFNQKYGTEQDYKRLYYLNTQYISSYVRSDTSTYNHLLWADDFVHQSGSSGSLVPKKEIAKEFGKPRFKSIEYFYADDIRIRFVSDNAALVFSSPPYRGFGDKEESLSRYNDVYIKRNSAWVCVSANITNIPKTGDKVAILTKIPPKIELISYIKGSETDHKKLTEINKIHAEAFMNSKPELLENILAEDFILLSSNGQLYEKPAILNMLKSSTPNSNLASYSIENLQIRFVANDIAMVHAALIEKLKDGSMKGTQYNDVYIKRGENWVCVSGNNTPIRN